MANADAAFGLRPVRYRSGHAYTGAAQKAYALDASNALAIGDPVESVGMAEASTGVPTVQRSTASGNIDGVIVGFLSDAGSDTLTRDFPRALPASASDGAFVMIETDPNVVYEIQEDSDGGSIQAASQGLHASLALATPDSVNGISQVEIDSSTVASDTTTPPTLPLKLVSLAQRPDNELGTNAIWEVMITKSTFGFSGTSR